MNAVEKCQIIQDICRVAQKITFGGDVSNECPLIVAAARIYAKDQEQEPEEYVPSWFMEPETALSASL